MTDLTSARLLAGALRELAKSVSDLAAAVRQATRDRLEER